MTPDRGGDFVSILSAREGVWQNVKEEEDVMRKQNKLIRI